MPPAASTIKDLPPATKEAPFVNSLGMKFVPVPGTNILMCTTETTVEQYRSSQMTASGIPPFPQTGDHPIVGVNWQQAKAWCEWLSKREGRRYRLPSDREWTEAAGVETYPWGNTWPPPTNTGNFAGQELRNCSEQDRQTLLKSRGMVNKGFMLINNFSDRHIFTAPVGSYPPNRLGIHDLGGNVSEWGRDNNPNKHPFGHPGKFPSIRGGTWNSALTAELTTASHTTYIPFDRWSYFTGFRVVLAPN
ncbi:formylglycine-generating enzyme family protein [Prosthecobacter fusiformis]|nr:SUMF1/EgtB/PvdO family nonheme iron enzyme [Prosthecobacter fusiformis]